MLVAILPLSVTSLSRPSSPPHFSLCRYRRVCFVLRAGDGTGGEASEEEPGFKIDAEKAREALRQLDQELEALSQNETPVPASRRRPSPSQELYNKNDPMMDPKMAKSDEAMLPELTDSFLAYTAAFLLFITLVYNAVFILIIKPSIDNATDTIPPTSNKQLNSTQKVAQQLQAPQLSN